MDVWIEEQNRSALETPGEDPQEQNSSEDWKETVDKLRDFGGDSAPNKDDLVTCQEKVQRLRDESLTLYNELLKLRKDKEEFYDSFLQQRNRLVAGLADEISRTEEDLGELEIQLQNTQEDETSASGDDHAETSSTGSKTSHSRVEEDETKMTLADLKANMKKLKKEMDTLNRNLFGVQKECEKEESRNRVILGDLEYMQKMEEKFASEEKQLTQQYLNEDEE